MSIITDLRQAAAAETWRYPTVHYPLMGKAADRIEEQDLEIAALRESLLHRYHDRGFSEFMGKPFDWWLDLEKKYNLSER